MPTYEYYCESCSRDDIEVFQSMLAEPLDVCPECSSKGKIKRKISGGAGLIFRGSGFYETDYKKPAKAAPAQGSDKKPESSSSKPAASATD